MSVILGTSRGGGSGGRTGQAGPCGPAPCALDAAYRQTVAAMARLSDSARPVDRDAHHLVAEGAVGGVQAPGLVAEDPGVRGARGRPRRERVARPVGGEHAQPRGAQRRRRRPASGTPVTTGRWNSEPAVDRTTLGESTSTLASVTTTASAPAASATRRTVPALPGSRTWASTQTQRGRAASTSSSAVVRCRADGEQALRRSAAVGHGGEHLVGDPVHRQPGGAGVRQPAAYRSAAAAVT